MPILISGLRGNADIVDYVSTAGLDTLFQRYFIFIDGILHPIVGSVPVFAT